jgi:uncharacterized protein
LNTQTEDQTVHNAALVSRDQSLPPQPSTFHQIFIGADGLRAGRSILIFIACFVALVAAASAIGHKSHPPAPKTAAAAADRSISLRSALLDNRIPLIAIVLVTWIMSKIERRPNSVYGLGGSRKLSRFFTGLACSSSSPSGRLVSSSSTAARPLVATSSASAHSGSSAS